MAHPNIAEVQKCSQGVLNVIPLAVQPVFLRGVRVGMLAIHAHTNPKAGRFLAICNHQADDLFHMWPDCLIW